MRRYLNGSEDRRPKLIFAIFLIAAGILLFLSNLGFLPVHNVWRFWPLVFVAMGISRLSSGSPAALLAGGMLVIGGAIFTVINSGLIHIHFRDSSWPLSLLFLALGVGGLFRVLDGRDPGRRMRRRFQGDEGNQFAQADAISQTSHDLSPRLDHYNVMGTIKRKVESQAFAGGKLTSILGNIEIDLRRAKMPEGSNTAAIDANTILGSIKLRIPETWRVTWHGDSILSSLEDKTVPFPIANPPQLIFTGSSFMGSIEVES